MSHEKLAIQYMVGLMPLTNCRCLELDVLSSIKNMTKLAGMKDMANMTQIAIDRARNCWFLKTKQTLSFRIFIIHFDRKIH